MPRLLRSLPFALALATGCRHDAADDDCEGSDCGAHDSDGGGDGTSADSDVDGGADSDGGGDGGTARGLPCDVQDVVDRHCTGCHDDAPIFGAPMSLWRVDDWRVPSISDPAASVATVAAARIVDAVRPMPASGPMPAEDLAVLQAWIEAGTPSDDTACGGGGPEPDPVGPDALPCEPTVEFVAGDGDAAFHVPAEGADNLYQCFTFASPVGASTQATAWAPIVDDERVLHHWILFRTATPQQDGGSGPCNMPQDAAFVAGWAPGGGNYELPADVGLELGGSDVWFILQVHYHNVAHHPDAYDRSGVALCTVDEPREHTAGIVTLGTLGIAIPPGAVGHEAEGMCPSWVTQYLTEPLHAIASFPHMHQLGRKFRTEVLRGGEDGPAEVLVDVPAFNFENQTYYPNDPEVLIQAGDALRTTCTWDNPGDTTVHIGEATEDEMCFNFVMVWPIEAVGAARQCGPL
ncbi:MAG: hypothetical protein U0168_11560 [Nannocystaceae bacterium]